MSISQEQVSKLRKYIGKKIRVEYHIYSVSWDYGDSTSEVSDGSYEMQLTEVTAEHIQGILCQKLQYAAKGSMFTQAFSSSSDLPWGGSDITIRKIIAEEEIVFDASKKREKNKA
jgi:hypothetical protein